MNALVGYIRSSIDELRKVVWPTRQQVIRYTIIIAISVIVATAFIALIDFGLNLLVDEFILK